MPKAKVRELQMFEHQDGLWCVYVYRGPDPFVGGGCKIHFVTKELLYWIVRRLKQNDAFYRTRIGSIYIIRRKEVN